MSGLSHLPAAGSVPYHCLQVYNYLGVTGICWNNFAKETSLPGWEDGGLLFPKVHPLLLHDANFSPQQEQHVCLWQEKYIRVRGSQRGTEQQITLPPPSFSSRFFSLPSWWSPSFLSTIPPTPLFSALLVIKQIGFGLASWKLKPSSIFLKGTMCFLSRNLIDGSDSSQGICTGMGRRVFVCV